MQTITTKSARETQQRGEDFAKRLKKGDIVGLVGELGAGKTCFIQGLARGLKVPEDCYVSSPTFTILKIYPGNVNLYHFDFYRLSDPAEFDDLAFEDYVNEGGIVVIEWADKFLELLPKGIKVITFEVVGENERKITYEIQSPKLKISSPRTSQN